MTATAKKSRTPAKAAKGTQKSLAARGKTAPRTKKSPSVAIGKVESLADVISVANDAVMMQTSATSSPAAAVPQTKAAESDDRILLPARMEMASLDEAHQLLQSKYPPLSNKYILDGAMLSVIDSAGIQMLISFIRSTTAKGCKVEWDNYSVQVYQLASELGVTNQLGD